MNTRLFLAARRGVAVVVLLLGRLVERFAQHGRGRAVRSRAGLQVDVLSLPVDAFGRRVALGSAWRTDSGLAYVAVARDFCKAQVQAVVALAGIPRHILADNARGGASGRRRARRRSQVTP